MQQSGQISPDGYWIWNGAQWVPNPQRAYAYATPPIRPYEPATFRSRLAVGFLAANLLGLAVFSAFDMVDAIYSQTPNPGDAFTLADSLLALAGLIAYYSTLIAAIVFFCMWLHRVIRNMPALGSVDPRWSPARSVVYCFIPIANLFHPFLSVQDAWRGAEPTGRWLDVAARRRIGTAPILGIWWGLWLVGGLLSRIASRLDGATADEVDLVSSIVFVGAALLAILVVRDVTSRQERKQALIASGQLS
jgi:hypothetical protein